MPSIDEQIKLTIQDRASEEVPFFGTFFMGASESELAPWWSPRRDIDLFDFYQREGNDILQGAVSSLIKKFRAMNWVLTGPPGNLPGQINYHLQVLNSAEFGKGWNTWLSKFLQDYLTQDKGGFTELISSTPEGPIQSPGVLGIAHLDSQLCQPTGDLLFPIVFLNSKDNKAHKIHISRVAHIVDMPSPREQMLDIGFCSVSRVLSASNILLRISQYKKEKLSDLPQAGLLLLNNVLPGKWKDVVDNYDNTRMRKGHEYWKSVMTLFGVDPTQKIEAQFVDFSSLPDAFNEKEATDIYINIVALAFGVDAREFWPLSVGPLGTATEALVQHQKARGKGVGDIISSLERLINQYILPSTVTFKFDFQDDEEDKLSTEIMKDKVEMIMSMWKPPTRLQGDIGLEPPVSAESIRLMLEDQIPFFKESFLSSEKSMVDRYGNSKNFKPNISRTLQQAEKNYKEGRIDLDTLLEYRLGEFFE